ncbi:DEAD/DEAH box helicase family protein [Legionella quateirensis]|uniref:Type III restriction enzyme, res subunit n=1 Tax=Legionella quateirensis TaxID=45072 RepID=A0A378KUN4_9GAMM|nr:DEAD/DEAH box helicase family protein [Legionella quateirensis]KTD43419.1 Type III restriction enzyme, res subunit [Legionella quateirensis]STY18305.1 Type III restriction enzyme, res subunit [Legionella quateirensis]
MNIHSSLITSCLFLFYAINPLNLFDFIKPPKDIITVFSKMFRQSLITCNRAGLRPYQTGAINAIAQHSDSSGFLSMATGTGKSVIIAKLAFEAFNLLNDGEHVIIVTLHIKIMTQLWQSLVDCHIFRGKRELVPTDLLIQA